MAVTNRGQGILLQTVDNLRQVVWHCIQWWKIITYRIRVVVQQGPGGGCSEMKEKVIGRQENLQEIKEIITWHEEESNTETENLQEIKEISTCMVRMYWETYVKGRKRLFHHWMTCCKDILFPATTSFMQQKWSTYKSTQDFTQGVFFLNLKFKF